MNHLEQMEHTRQGVQWISVGQRDPLVEYRKQSQILYAEMQAKLRQTVLKILLRAQPVMAEQLQGDGIETNLTRAARNAIANAGRVVKVKTIDEADFKDSEAGAVQTAILSSKTIVSQKKKKRKQERQNRKKGRR